MSSSYLIETRRMIDDQVAALEIDRLKLRRAEERARAARPATAPTHESRVRKARYRIAQREERIARLREREARLARTVAEAAAATERANRLNTVRREQLRADLNALTDRERENKP